MTSVHKIPIWRLVLASLSSQASWSESMTASCKTCDSSLSSPHPTILSTLEIRGGKALTKSIARDLLKINRYIEIWKKNWLTSHFLCRKEEDRSLQVFCHPRVHYLKHRSHNDSTSTIVWLTLYQYSKQTHITWASTSRSPASVYFESTHFFLKGPLLQSTTISSSSSLWTDHTIPERQKLV